MHQSRKPIFSIQMAVNIQQMIEFFPYLAIDASSPYKNNVSRKMRLHVISDSFASKPDDLAFCQMYSNRVMNSRTISLFPLKTIEKYNVLLHSPLRNQNLSYLLEYHMNEYIGRKCTKYFSLSCMPTLAKYVSPKLMFTEHSSFVNCFRSN